MKLSIIARHAKRVIDERGGLEAAKNDLTQAKQAVQAPGSVGTKAGRAVAALRTARPASPPTAAQEAVDDGAVQPPER